MTNEKILPNMTPEEMATELEMWRFVRDQLFNPEEYWEIHDMFMYGYDPDHNDLKHYINVVNKRKYT